MSGWIKLHRSLKDWEWYDDIPATRLLIHLLLTVNYEDKKWKGLLIHAGTRVTSFGKLASETGLTVKQVRLALNKLEKSGEIARKRAHEGQAITLCKWDKLQSQPPKRASEGVDEGQDEGTQRATTKESKNLNNEKKEEESEVEAFSPNVETTYTFLIDFFEDEYKPKDNIKIIRWKSEIDKLNRLDGHGFSTICSVIQWALTDSFWKDQGNFLSLLKARRPDKDGIKFFDRFKHDMEIGKSGSAKYYTWDEMVGLPNFKGKWSNQFGKVHDDGGRERFASLADIKTYNLKTIEK